MINLIARLVWSTKVRWLRLFLPSYPHELRLTQCGMTPLRNSLLGPSASKKKPDIVGQVQ